MSHTDNWNATFEALPTDDNYGYEIDNYLRIVWRAIRERMEIDHYWKATASTTDDGKHKKITLPVLASAPTAIASTGILYVKDVSAKAELFYIDEDGNEIQLSSAGSGGGGDIPTGTKMLFYMNAAPLGWTLQNTLDDKVVFVTKGSAAGGQTGGVAHTTGTWTQPDHTLTVAEMPEHNHGFNQAASHPGTGSRLNNGGTDIYSGLTGGDGAHNHGTAWRPAAYNFIICAKAA